jgi:hypothetical protein
MNAWKPPAGDADALSNAWALAEASGSYRYRSWSVALDVH